MTLEGSKTVPIKELNGQQMILHRHVRKTKAPRCKNVVKKAQDKINGCKAKECRSKGHKPKEHSAEERWIKLN